MVVGMSMLQTPVSVRTHIGFFGPCNAGKSSVVNAVTSQRLSIVSPLKGTTTDPVFKTMELLPLGPVVVIDTPGFDDQSELGEQRVKRTKDVLSKCDIAVMILDATQPRSTSVEAMLSLIEGRKIPYVVALNKCDLLEAEPTPNEHEILVSAKTGEGIQALKERLGHLKPDSGEERHIVKDLLKPGETVVLVTPIDSAAPKGRMILPQQQTIRDVLDSDCLCMVVKETQLSEALGNLKDKPAMVITDSQAFERVAKDTPPDIPLTSFSILMARYKGVLEQSVRGVVALHHLKDGDTVLMAEGCTHHRQCSDIGTVKIPAWLRKFTHADIKIATCSGNDFPDDLRPYAAIIHCGGCMLTPQTVSWRMQRALDEKVAMTNYGVAIAQMKGILKRSLSLFPDLAALVEA